MAQPSVSSSASPAGAQGAAGMAGAWRLNQGSLVALQPAQPARLRIVRGHVWVTLGGALERAGSAGDHVAGDVFLHAGDVLWVPRGARLVMESLSTGAEPVVLFDWVEASAQAARAGSGRFRRDVLAPGRDLALALRQAAVAFTRLARGLLGYGEFLVAGRGRVLSRFEGNPP